MISKSLTNSLIHLEATNPGEGISLRQALVANLPPMPAGIDLHSGLPWQNYGENLSVASVARQYVVWNDTGNGTRDWRAGLSNLTWVTRNAEANGYRLRPQGQTWSFSPCVETADTIVDTRALSIAMPDLQDADLAAGTGSVNFAHVQAGMIVDTLNRYLEGSRRAVWTIGGNAGQTIGGALATGTHGSFWERPPIADYVAALTLVTEGGQALWLEPASKPLTAPTFTAWGAFKVVRDDDLFAAAVVSLGCLGVVFSVVLKVRALTYLDYTRSTRDFDAAVQAALYSNDSSGLGLTKTPDHFEVVLNPYALGTGQKGAHVTVSFDDVPTSTPIVNPPAGPALDMGMLVPILKAIATNPSLVPSLVALVVGIIYNDRHALGPFSVTTPVSKTDGVPTISMEVAFPRSQLKAVLDHILNAIKAAQPGFFLPGVLGIRFTQPSKLPLAFTRFTPETCTIEFACMGGVAGTTSFLDGLLASIIGAGFAAMPHPGQYFAPSPSMLSPLGADLTRWKTARKKLLPTMGAVYSNAFSDALKLTP